MEELEELSLPLSPSLPLSLMKVRALFIWLLLAAGLTAAQAVAAQSATPFAREVVVADSNRDERLEAVAYNTTRGEALVVWSVDTGGGDTDLWARRARPEMPALWVGAAFPIAATTAPERRAQAVFNPLDEDFLIVYERRLPSGDIDIIGQRVAGRSGGGDNGPELRGASFAIANSILKEEQPDVAFLPATQQFLVVYTLSDDVWAQRVARYRFGDGGGELIGSRFVVTADLENTETTPTVIASLLRAYFLVAYAYEFGTDDFDVRGQRIHGMAVPGSQLLDTAFDIAFDSADETEPRLAYNQNRQTILAVWTATAGGNRDVRAVWLDDRIQTGSPVIGVSFPVAAGLVAQEWAPSPAVDPIGGETVVALNYERTAGSTPRLGLVWVQDRLPAPNPIAQPLALFPERPFPVLAPRLLLCPARPCLLLGYNARFGISPNFEHDAHLLVGGRWTVVAPRLRRGP